MTREENIKRFEELLLSTGRDGMEKFIKNVIRKFDFYDAPASQMNYKAYRGGLLEHVLDVYDIMVTKAENENTVLGQALKNSEVTMNNIIIAALLHDCHKINHFKSYTKNVKNRDREAIELAREAGNPIKTDSDGEFIWEQVTGYTVDDTFPLTGTNKAFSLISFFLKLNWSEYAAIASVRGPGKEGLTMNSFCQAAKQYPLVIALYEAKLEAMLLPPLEKTEDTVEESSDGETAF